MQPSRALVFTASAVSHAITQRLVRRLSREPEKKKIYPLATRIGRAFVFVTIFVVIWLALSLVLVFPFVRSHAS